MEPGNIEVDYRYVRPQPPDLVECRLAVRTLGHDLEMRDAKQDGGQAVAAQYVLIRQQDRNFIGSRHGYCGAWSYFSLKRAARCSLHGYRRRSPLRVHEAVRRRFSTGSISGVVPGSAVQRPAADRMPAV